MNTAKQLPFQVFKFQPQSQARVNQSAIIVNIHYTCRYLCLTCLTDATFLRSFKNGGMAQVVHSIRPLTLNLYINYDVVVCRGVNDQIKMHAQNLADRTGAVTVVPDIYKGKIGVTAEASVIMSIKQANFS